ncbi:MAG TPA: TadE family protein [Gammaproteobacteria bacterium]
MAETVIILPVMLLLVLGALQFALIYHAKITLNYATFEAARAGALNYGSRRAMEYALARGLTPLYTSVRPGESDLDKMGEVKAVYSRIMNEINGADPAVPDDADDRIVCIERLNPGDDAFVAHGINLGGVLPDPIIPNDNLLYRSTDTNGADVSVQDANLLKIKVTYCYHMIVPFISNLIQKLMLGSADPDDPEIPEGWNTPTTLGNFKEACYADERFPVESVSIVRMQTPVFNDYFRSDCG